MKVSKNKMDKKDKQDKMTGINNINSDDDNDNNKEDIHDNNSNSDNNSDNNSDDQEINQNQTQSKSKIRTDFIKFLNEHRYKKDSNMVMTHTGMGINKGSYSFVNKDYTKFIKLYKMMVETEQEVNMVERSREVSPLIIDVDFNTENNERYYTSKHVKEIIRRYNFVVNKYIKLDTPARLMSYVFEKDEPTEKDTSKTIYKDGFHVYYPNLNLSTDLRYFIYHLATESIKDDTTFMKDIPYINSLDEIFDASVIKNNGMMMHGSNKPNRKPYILTKAYDNELNKMNIKGLTQSDIIDLTALRQWEDDESLKYKSIVDKTEVKSMIEDINLLYCGGNKKKEKINNNIDDICDRDDRDDRDDKHNYKLDFTTLSEVNRESDKEQIDLARELVKILSIKRSEKYEDWRNVGWALHKIDVTLLEDFIIFSKKCPKKYEAGCCEKLWMEAKDKAFCMPSLKKWAREDNPKEYDKILLKRKFEKVKIAISGTHVDIASLVYEKYKDEFVYSDNQWYHFNRLKHRWEMMEDAIELANLIKIEIKKDFNEYLSAFNNDIQQLQKMILDKKRKNRIEGRNNDINDILQVNDDNMIENTEGIREHNTKKLPEIVRMLGDINFIDKIVKACKLNFRVGKFKEKLNSNPYLIGFNNGVLDLDPLITKPEDRFRDGKPDDYISCSVNYNYKQTFTQTSKEVISIKEYFKQVHSNPNKRLYVMKFLASCLVGINKEQKFNFWSGVGGNGKSTTLELVRHTWGDYYGKLSVSFFTHKRKGSNEASPELVNIMYARFVQVDEPDETDTFYVGQMKEMTGGDVITIRGLHKDPVSIKPQFKFVLCCNNKPRIDDTSRGTWRRVIDVFHASIFTNNPDPQDENQFKVDENLTEKLKDWNQAFMWLLVNEYYPQYLKEGNEPPIEVMKSTMEYQMESDLLLQFMSDNIVKSPNESDDVVLVEELYGIYKIWFKESFGGKVIDKKEFVKNLIAKKYKIEGNRYIKGIRFIEDDRNKSKNN